MPYIASDPASYKDTVVGSGQCVAFVQQTSGAPLTHLWSKGGLVKGCNLTAGTAIATFDADGAYGNHTDGTSHAAIYIGQSANGIDVWDQWLGQPVHTRTIHFGGAALGKKPVNDGDAYYVIA
jgi:hypothetical protein